MSRHLFLALSTKGFGETILGLQVARRLRQRGEEPVFLIHESSVPLLQSSPFEFMTISEHAGALLPMFVAELADHDTATIILSDFFTTDLWLDHHGLDHEFLTQRGVPIVAIDTWCIKTTGAAIDIYWQKTRQFEDWTDELAMVIQPVPLAPPAAGRQVYSCLPRPADAGPAGRDGLRARLGIADTDKVALFCTAGWQQTKYSCEHAQRFAAALPVLLARYWQRLGPDVHLVHVGPHSYEMPLDGRYHWLSQLAPAEFDAVLGGADLLLTANISSTTIAKAMVSGIPVLAMINSHEIRHAGDLARLGHVVDDEDAAPWARQNLPLYRYYMWPVGYYRFLDPLLRDSAYLEAVPTVELLDRRAVVTQIEALLHAPAARALALRRQARYVASLEGLPDPADLVMRVTSRVE